MEGGDLLAAVDALYVAALAPDEWPAALQRIVDLCGGAGATLELHERRTRELLFFRDQGMPDDGVEAYQAYYHTVCPRLPWGRNEPVGMAIYDYRFLSESEMRGLEFYEDFLAEHDFRYVVGGVVASESDRFGIIAVHRTRRAGHADDATIDTARRLLPHVARTLELHRRLAVAGAVTSGLRGAMETMTIGVVLLSEQGDILEMNDEARRLCGGDSALDATRRKLVARDPRDGARLQALLRCGGSLVLGPHGSHPLSVMAAPLPRRTPGSWMLVAPDQAVTAVFIQDPGRSPTLGDEVLAGAYGLTPAEMQLARAMVEGRNLAEDAERRRVSLNTVRTQLKRLRAKLGARSQADLVLRLSRLVPPVRHPSG